MADKPSASDEELLMSMIILGVLIGVGFVLWLGFKPQIINGLRYIRIVQMEIGQMITPKGYAVQYPDMRTPIRLDKTKEFLVNADITQITPKHIAVASDMALQPLRVPMGMILLLFGVYIFVYGPHTKFKKVHTLDDLMRKQVKAFPYIKPLLDFDPRDTPHRAPGDPVPEELPLFAEALSPEEWIAHNNVPMPDGKMDEEAAAEALAKQLKGRWQGWEKSPPYVQIMLAALALRAVRDRHESDVMLGRISMCWDHKNGLRLSSDPKLLGEARAILRGKKAQDTLKIMRQHAYVTTAMVRALDYARSQGGVISPGQFLWLRGHDRQLWYPLNNLGRQAFHPEAVGAMAHYKLEKLTERPVPTPIMDGAMATLKTYFASGYARPIPPLAQKKKPQRDKIAV